MVNSKDIPVHYPEYPGVAANDDEAGDEESDDEECCLGGSAVPVRYYCTALDLVIIRIRSWQIDKLLKLTTSKTTHILSVSSNI